MNQAIKKQKHFRINILLILIIVVLPVPAATMYLPVLPHIAHALHSSDTLMRLSFSLYLLCFALSQLLYGPISDAYGRKSPLLFSLGLFIAGCVVSAFSLSGIVFVIARLLQGIGAGGITCIARCIGAEMLDEAHFAKLIKYAMILRSIIGLSAPILGAYTSRIFGWQSIFIILLSVTLILLIMLKIYYTETNIHKQSSTKLISNSLFNYKNFLKDRILVSNSMVMAFSFSISTAFSTAGPFLYQRGLNASSVEFAYIALIIATIYTVGAFLSTYFDRQFGKKKAIYSGLIITLASTIILLIMATTKSYNIALVTSFMSSASFGIGIVLPLLMAFTMKNFGVNQGIVSGILGFIEVAGSGLVSIAVAISSASKLMPLASICTAVGAAGLILFYQLSAKSIKS